MVSLGLVWLGLATQPIPNIRPVYSAMTREKETQMMFSISLAGFGYGTSDHHTLRSLLI